MQYRNGKTLRRPQTEHEGLVVQDDRHCNAGAQAYHRANLKRTGIGCGDSTKAGEYDI